LTGAGYIAQFLKSTANIIENQNSYYSKTAISKGGGGREKALEGLLFPRVFWYFLGQCQKV